MNHDDEITALALDYLASKDKIAEAVHPAFEALSEKYHPVNIDLDGKITSIDEHFARPTIDYNVTTADALQPELGSVRCGYAGCNVSPEDRCSLCPQDHRTTWADVKLV